MQRKFQKYIEQFELIDSDDTILIAVSGGIDSIVLLNLLYNYHAKISVAHCNFQLRGTESDNDEQFVAEFCKEKNIPFYSKRFNTKEFAEGNKVSIQMAARTLRYDWFNELMKTFDFSKLATAHHKNDNNETVLLNLVRGTGIKGLTGIQPIQNNIIRPLLFAQKQEINEYAKKNNLKWREDASNTSNKYKRNSVRNEVIPMLEKINPDFNNRFSENIEKFNEVNTIYQNYIQIEINNVFKDNSIDITKLKNTISSISVLWEIIKEYNFTYSDAKDIIQNLDAESGKQFISTSHIILKNRDFFLLKKNKKPESECISIQIDAEIINFSIGNLVLRHGTEINNENIKKSNFAFLDSKKIKFPLTLRNWQNGDHFKPFGMNGYQKLSDFLTNKKHSLFEKEKVYVLLSEDEIVWVVNHRISNDYKINSTTQNVLQVEFKQNEE